MSGYALTRNYTIREANHNHPGGDPTPSEGDVNLAKAISDKFTKAVFNIFRGPNDPVPYNKNSNYVKPDYPGAKIGTLTPGKKW